MERFSVRNGNLKLLENLEDCTDVTRKRLWQVFAHNVYLMDKTPSVKYDIVEDLLAYFNLRYHYSLSPHDHGTNCNLLKSFIYENAKWYQVYDFVEYHLSHGKDIEILAEEYNKVLLDEKTGYKIISGCVVPITNDFEVKQIEDALRNSPEHVAKSFNLSLKHFSERENPDYNNAIKEAITSVEALCCTIVEGKENTLGRAVSKFEEYGINLNEHLLKGIQELYKYTCNEDGKRHGGTTYIESDIEDAKFMIVTCSAIANYLLVKWDKAKNKEEEQ